MISVEECGNYTVALSGCQISREDRYCSFAVKVSITLLAIVVSPDERRSWNLGDESIRGEYT
jgi:hypothetical protein